MRWRFQQVQLPGLKIIILYRSIDRLERARKKVRSGTLLKRRSSFMMCTNRIRQLFFETGDPARQFSHISDLPFSIVFFHDEIVILIRTSYHSHFIACCCRIANTFKMKFQDTCLCIIKCFSKKLHGSKLYSESIAGLSIAL